MSEKRMKPSRWTYAVAALIPVFGCLIAMALVYQWFPGLPDTFESDMNLGNLTQVVVPGSEEITFAESGAYAVYYEYRSVVDGAVYASGEIPPALACTLTSRATGADAGVVPDYVKTNTYSTKERERVGVLISSILIKNPGTYIFSCQYTDGGTCPQIALSVGPNFGWEFLNIAAKPVAAMFFGTLVFVAACGISLLVLGFVAVKRHQSKNNGAPTIVP